MNSTTTFCGQCLTDVPALAQVDGMCVWCAYRKGLITGQQLAEHERRGWAAGFPTLPHTFRQDAIDK